MQENSAQSIPRKKNKSEFYHQSRFDRREENRTGTPPSTSHDSLAGEYRDRHWVTHTVFIDKTELRLKRALATDAQQTSVTPRSAL